MRAEIRKPTSEIRKKSECPNQVFWYPMASIPGHSDFGFLSGFGSRASDFELMHHQNVENLSLLHRVFHHLEDVVLLPHPAEQVRLRTARKNRHVLASMRL